MFDSSGSAHEFKKNEEWMEGGVLLKDKASLMEKK